MAKPRLRKCAISYCTRQIPGWLHFCAPHYKLLPKLIKDGLSQEWRYMKRNGCRSTARQLEMVRMGIETVTGKQLEKAAKRRRESGDLVAGQQGANP